MHIRSESGSSAGPRAEPPLNPPLIARWYSASIQECQRDREVPVSQSNCRKCGGKLVLESYPMEEMLVSKCFVCGKIDRYRELSREESRRLFRRVDQPRLLERLAS